MNLDDLDHFIKTVIEQMPESDYYCNHCGKTLNPPAYMGLPLCDECNELIYTGKKKFMDIMCTTEKIRKIAKGEMK